MKFQTTVRLNGKTATGLVVPSDVVAALGTSKRPKVVVTIGTYTYRSSIAPMGGEYLISVSEEVRKGAGIAAGDTVNVEVILDTEPRVVTVPAELATALDGDAEAKRAFETLSYSHQLQHVLAIEQAKTAETRQRRIEKTLAMLREG